MLRGKAEVKQREGNRLKKLKKFLRERDMRKKILFLMAMIFGEKFISEDKCENGDDYTALVTGYAWRGSLYITDVKIKASRIC